MLLPMFGWILFGLVVAVIARAVMTERARSHGAGPVGMAIIGMLGALFAGWVGEAWGEYGANDAAGFFTATLGAALFLAIAYAITTSRKKGKPGFEVGEADRVADPSQKVSAKNRAGAGIKNNRWVA